MLWWERVGRRERTVPIFFCSGIHINIKLRPSVELLIRRILVLMTWNMDVIPLQVLKLIDASADGYNEVVIGMVARNIDPFFEALVKS